jgi:hypothetical protein
MINIREEIKQIVEDNLDFQWDSEEMPLTKAEFINLLTEKFQELQEKVQREQLIETTKNKFYSFKLN